MNENVFSKFWAEVEDVKCNTEPVWLPSVVPSIPTVLTEPVKDTAELPYLVGAKTDKTLSWCSGLSPVEPQTNSVTVLAW